MNLKDKKLSSMGKNYYSEEDVKQFIKEILDLLDDDVDKREKYLSEQIKQKAGELGE